jgi:eukaryotic-like serine/threonine-protein kinase
MAKPGPGRMVANRYAFKTPLGRGGMGVVWHAHDVVLGREVAVKEVVLPPTLPDSERRSAQARVMREARAAARLQHPNTVTVSDVIQDRGSTFIVMELVRAPTLAELVRAEGPLPPERVVEIGAQVASALEAAHRAGIVHRDVTPGNVMVPSDGPAKLADFGIASLQGDPRLTSAGLAIGSPAYMAPEQAKGEPTGPPTDSWGLGATMFYAVEGEPPFDKDTSIAILTAVVNDEPRPMRRAGPLAPLLTALLAKNPARRPPATALRAVSRLLAVRPARPTEDLHVQGLDRTARFPSVPPESSLDSVRAAAPSTAPGPSPRSEGTPAFEPARPPDRPGTAATRRPSRPVLPPVPPVRRRGRGLFGLLALLLVGGLLVAWLVNGVGVGQGGDRAAPATTQGTTGTTGTSEPAAPTTEAPGPTQAPTTATAAAAAAQGGLPPGWRAFVNRAGNDRVGVPPGFQARTRSSYNAAVVEEQRAPRRVFTVRSTTPANPLPQASRDYRAWARRNFAGFQEVRYAENQTYAGRKGAVVFEYEAVRDGRRVHVSHINFKGRTWGYNVEFITAPDQWNRSTDLARQFEQAFSPLG